MPESRDDAVVRAAGAVVWRPGAAGPQIALVHRPRYDDWSHPKGKCQRGEHVLAAAVREVTEETGLRVVLGRPLSPSVYQVAGRVKQVSYWAARCVEAVGFVPNQEVDEVVWLPAAAARDRLTYPRDVALLDELRTGPVRSVPFILLRHAAAGRKSAAGDGDLARPLDATGTAEAKLLAGLLACYGPCRVISSAAERCIATVRPYAAMVGAPVEVEPAFTISPEPMPAGDLLMAGVGQRAEAGRRSAAGRKPHGNRNPSDSQAAGSSEAAARWGSDEGGEGGEGGEAAVPEARALAAHRAAELAASGVPTLICAHRENLPAIIDAAFGSLGAGPPQGQPLRKGAFLVLQSAGGVLVSSERHEVNE